MKKKALKVFTGIEQIFGSKTRFALLKLFYQKSDKIFFMRELARLLNNQLNSVRREVANLADLGILKEAGGSDAKKKYYKLNTDFVLCSELGTLIIKSELLAEKSLADMLGRISGIDLCIFTGALLKTEAPCDILVVGRVNKNELEKIIRQFEKDTGRVINYAVFSPEEYKQRKALTDKFLFGVLEGKKMIAIDKYGELSE